MSSAVGTSDEVDRVRRSLSTGAPAWCSYYGVTCNSNSTSATYASVTQISLVSQGLVGTIPSSIGSLTLLQTLWIGNNRLSGSIPSSIGSLMGVMAAFSPSLTLWLLSHDF